MPVSQPGSQLDDELSDKIERSLLEALATDAAPPRPASRPPASSAGPTPGDMWGLQPTRVHSPMQLLAEVADNTMKLQEQMEKLVTEVTGEQVTPKRFRQPPAKGYGLLPAISQLAHQIDAAHADLGRLIVHVRRQVR